MDFAVYQKKNIRVHVEGVLPMLEEFSDVFLGEQMEGIGGGEYQHMQIVWMDILKDIALGLKENDRILLEDTVEYGLKVFLELFFEEQELQGLKEACVVR